MLRAEAPAFHMPPPGLGSLCSEGADASPWSASTEAPSPAFFGYASSADDSPWISPFMDGCQEMEMLWLPESAHFEDFPSWGSDCLPTLPAEFSVETEEQEDDNDDEVEQEQDTVPPEEFNFKLAGTEDLQNTLASIFSGLCSKPLHLTLSDEASTKAATSDEDSSQPPTPPSIEDQQLTADEPTSKTTQMFRWSVAPSKEPIEELPRESRQVTVTVQNVPRRCARDQFAKFLDEAGFHGEYDFLYVTADLKQRSCGSGSAVVSFRTEEACRRFTHAYHKVGAKTAFPAFGGKNKIEVLPAPLQGRDANVLKLKKSSCLMSLLLGRPEWQPALFNSDGEMEVISI